MMIIYVMAMNGFVGYYWVLLVEKSVFIIQPSEKIVEYVYIVIWIDRVC